MPSFIFLAPVVALGLFLIPIGLLRRKAYPRRQDYFVSSNPTRLNVIKNSSISHALKVAMFFPLFAWGASGDFWPAAIASISFGLGLWLTYALRRPLFAFLGTALSRDGSITIVEFIAQQHGGDRRLRLLASALTLLALIGLAIVETLGVATVLRPILSDSIGALYAMMFGLLAIVVLYTALAGNSGVLHATQLQLGILYLGLFGTTLLLLYLLVSELRPVPPHGILAVAFIAALCVIMPIYRRVRYIETGPVRDTAADDDDVYVRSPAWGVKRLVTLEKILNLCIAVLSGFAAAFAIMELYFAGFPTLVHDSLAALQSGPSVSSLALAALFLLPLFGQIVDVTNWQRIAVFEKDRDPNDPDLGKRLAAFRRMWMSYAIETPLMWLFLCAFGAVAVISTATPDGAYVMRDFVGQLASQENFVAASALSLLLLAVLAMALSTMSPLLSASLCVVRYDVMPAIWPEPAPGEMPAAREADARRRIIAVGGGFCAIIAAVVAGAEYFRVEITGTDFLALLFGCSSVQLAFVPLVLGPLIGRANGAGGSVGAGWAMAIVGFGAAVGVGAVAAYLATGAEAWLWAAVPACLATGGVLFTVARLWPATSLTPPAPRSPPAPP
jgi:hypothetical protein